MKQINYPFSLFLSGVGLGVGVMCLVLGFYFVAIINLISSVFNLWISTSE